MCPKFVYQHQYRLSPWIWIYLLLCCHLSKAFWTKCAPWWLICQFLLNLKVSIIKSFIWNSKRLYATKSQNGAVKIRSLEPQLSYKWQCYFLYLFKFKACFYYYFHVSPSYEKCFLFHLNCSFSSCNIQILGGNQKLKHKQLWHHVMDCVNYQL